MSILTAIILAILAMLGIEPATHDTPPPPIEHVVYDGDRIDISTPDILTIRIPGADAYDEDYYRQYCADMGGTFAVRLLPGDDPDEEYEPEVVCEDVDY